MLGAVHEIMDHSTDTVLPNIRQYALQARELQEEQMDVGDSSHTEARLERTIKELQAQVEHQKAALEKVRFDYHSPSIASS